LAEINLISLRLVAARCNWMMMDRWLRRAKSKRGQSSSCRRWCFDISAF